MAKVECNLLYDSSKNFALIKGLLKADYNLNARQGLRPMKLLKVIATKDTLFRLVSNTGDETEDIVNARNQFLHDCDQIMRNIEQEKNIPLNESVREKWLADIGNFLNFNNNTQTDLGATTEANEGEMAGTNFRLEDRNLQSLRDHIIDFYGYQGEFVQMHIANTFRNMIMSCIAFDATTNRIILETNPVLNNLIKGKKEQLYQTIRKYLLKAHPEDELILDLPETMYPDAILNPGTAEYRYGKPNLDAFRKVVNAFWKLEYKVQGNFFSRTTEAIARDYILQRDNIRSRKTEQYATLFNELLENDPTFKKYLLSNLGDLYESEIKGTASKQLFAGQHYSKYFIVTQEYILKSIERSKVEDPDKGAKYPYKWDSAYVNGHAESLLAQLDDIQNMMGDFGGATMAYTMLTHFDELINLTTDDLVDINDDAFGYEDDSDNKYKHARQVAKHAKNWSAKDDTGTVDRTSAYTANIINSIEIRDYYTGDYTDQHMTLGTYMRAFNRLFEYIRKNVDLSKLSGKNAKLVGKEMLAAAKNYREDPVGNLCTILNALFASGNYGKPLIEQLEMYNELDQRTLNICYSAWETIFNMYDPMSIYNQVVAANRSRSFTFQMRSILEEMAGFLHKNKQQNYLETQYDFRTGKFTTKYSSVNESNHYLFQDIEAFNSYLNNTSDKERLIRVTNQYEFNNSSLSQDDNTQRNKYYNISIPKENDEKIWIRYQVESDSALRYGVFSRTGNNRNRVFSPDVRLDNLEKINVNDFVVNLQTTGRELAGDEKTLFQLLRFFDDVMGTRISYGGQDANTFLQYVVASKQNQGHWLRDMLEVAIRGRYTIEQNLHALNEMKSLTRYLRDVSDPLYTQYSRRYQKYRQVDRYVFNNSFNILSYKVLNNTDKFVENWARAQAAIGGRDVKMATRTLGRDNVPTFNTVNLAERIHERAGEIDTMVDNGESTVLAPNLFANGTDSAILSISTDYDIKDESGRVRKIQKLSTSELMTHAIFDKFWGSYYLSTDYANPKSKNGCVHIQPRCFSDKSTIIQFYVRLAAIARGKISATTSVNEMIELYAQTQGQVWVNVHENVRADLAKIAEAYYKNSPTKGNKGVTAKNATDADIKHMLHSLTEQELLGYGESLNIDLERDLHYRVVKNADGKKVCGVNEILWKNGRDYGLIKRGNDNVAKDIVYKRFKQGEVDMLKMLINGRVKFQAFNESSAIDDFMADPETIRGNAEFLYKYAVEIFGENNTTETIRKFLNDWIDEGRNELILARKKDANGSWKNIKRISDIPSDGEIELNPLLEKYMYIVDLCADNIATMLTGLDANNKVGKITPFENAKKVENVEDWNKLGYGVISEVEFTKVKNVLDACLDVDDLYVALNEGAKKSLGVGRVSLENLLDKCYLWVEAKCRSTESKRQNSSTAPYKGLNLNAFSGVGKYCNFAIFDDIVKEFWDQRARLSGEGEVHNGGMICGMPQVLLENKSLGPDAAGENRKPIATFISHHTGTSAQIKCAVYTITNRTMRMTLCANLSDYNLFKKMYDYQWTTSDNIDLLRSAILNKIESNSRARDVSTLRNQEQVSEWFRTEVLGNQKLYYEYKDEIQEIRGFGRDANGIYFTEERGMREADSHKVFHVFYDTETRQHIHKKLHSSEAVKKFIEENPNANVHTINSLYELWEVLGGYNCCTQTGEVSEFNHEVVVAFMNNIGERVNAKESEVRDKDYLDQTTYRQPLKDKYCSYFGGTECFKKYKVNVNSVDRWYDDKPVRTVKIKMDGFGIQQDSELTDLEHTDVSEQSQMISLLESYGKNHEDVKRIYQILGEQARLMSKELAVPIKKLMQEFGAGASQIAEAQSELYDYLTRLLVRGYVANETSQLGRVLDDVAQIFNKHSDHAGDKIKVPFSSGAVFSELIKKIIEVINKDVVKRRAIGGQFIKRPGYDIYQYFEVYDRERDQVYKMFAPDVLRNAKEDYKDYLIAFIKDRVKGKNVPENLKAYVSPEGQQSLETMTWSRLQDLVHSLRLRKVDVESLPTYYSRLQGVDNAYEIDRILSETYLESIQKDAKLCDSRDPFQMYDIVQIVQGDDPENLKIIDNIELSDPKAYYNFKDGFLPNGLNINELSDIHYRICSTKPNNLKHSTLTFKVEIDGNIHTRSWMDLDIVHRSYENPESVSDKELQNALDTLCRVGTYVGRDGVERSIIKDSLIKNPNEIIIGNYMAKKFGIREGDSINDVLKQGAEYFRRQFNSLKTSPYRYYDVAFARTSGVTDLISFNDDFKQDPTAIYYGFGNYERIVTDNYNGEKRNRIYAVSKASGELRFEIGRWVDVKDGSVICDEQGNFISSQTNEFVDQNKYRLTENGNIQKRLDFVDLYRVRETRTDEKGNQVAQMANLFRVADRSVFEEALGVNDELDQDTKAKLVEDARKLQALVVYDIYSQGHYAFAEFNSDRVRMKDRVIEVDNVLEIMKQHAQPDVVELLNRQKYNIQKPSNENKEGVISYRKVIINRLVAAKWASFNTYLENLGSRIPAQSLASFKSHKVIGWVHDQNVAIDSPYEEWDEGSDFDGDESYVSGFDYDENGNFVGWSNYFSAATPEILVASRELPVAMNIQYQFDESGVDITKDVQELLKYSMSSDDTWKGRKYLTWDVVTKDAKSSKERIAHIQKNTEQFIRTLARILKKIEANDNRFYLNLEVNGQNVRYILQNTLDRHSTVNQTDELRLKALKNASISTILQVLNNPINFIQENIFVNSQELSDIANKTAQGQQESDINVLNPLNTYFFQHLNADGKQGIPIFANGIKAYMALMFMWTEVLKSGNLEAIENLKFEILLPEGCSLNLSREGKQSILNHIADLDIMSTEIAQAIKNVFYDSNLTEAEKEELLHDETKFVDRIFSQLMTAATDNAKDPILGKINANPKYAKMFVTLVMLGVKIKDIVAFMTSPVAEFIIKRTDSNFYISTFPNRQGAAIDAANGIVPVNYLLRGIAGTETETGERVGGEKRDNRQKKMKEHIVEVLTEGLRAKHSGSYIGEENAIKLISKICQRIDVTFDERWYKEGNKDIVEESHEFDEFVKRLGQLNLRDLMRHIINSAVEINLDSIYKLKSKEEDVFARLFLNDEFDYNSEYIYACQDLFEELKEMCQAYSVEGEMSSDEIWAEKVKRAKADISAFSDVTDVSDEITSFTTSLLGLNQGIPTTLTDIVKNLKNIENIVKTPEKALGIVPIAKKIFTEGLDQKIIDTGWKELYDALSIRRKAWFEHDSKVAQEKVQRIFTAAHEMDMIGNFDARRYIMDRKYRQVAIEYLDLIKLMTNGFRLMDILPHYKAIMERYMQLLYTLDNGSAKSRLMLDLTPYLSQFITYDSIKHVERYADEIIVRSYLERKDPIKLEESFLGFDSLMTDHEISEIDLSTKEGVCSFMKFMVTKIFPDLKEKNPNNLFVKHLRISTDNGRDILATDVNLRSPQTTIERTYFSECVAGLSELGTISYNEQYTYADLFVLYNIIQNRNEVGDERLTSLFTRIENKIMSEYNYYIGHELDYSRVRLDFNISDLHIAMAPSVSSKYALASHTEPYIYLADPVYGYKLMYYSGNTKQYYEYTKHFDNLKSSDCDASEFEMRKSNLCKYYPFMISTQETNNRIAGYIDAVGTERFNDNFRHSLSRALGNFTLCGKVYLTTEALNNKTNKVFLNIETNESSNESGDSLIPFDLGKISKSVEAITMDDVVGLIEKLPQDKREDLSLAIRNAQCIELTEKMIESGNFKSNTSIDDLYTKNNIVPGDIPIDLNTQEQYVLITAGKLKLDGQRIFGRIILPDGRVAYCMKNNFYSQRAVLRHISQSQKIAKACAKGNEALLKLIPKELHDDLRHIAAVYRYKDNYKDLFIDYTCNNGKYKLRDERSTGSFINTKNVLDTALAYVLGNEYEVDLFTDLERLFYEEAEESEVKVKEQKVKKYTIRRDRLYKILDRYSRRVGDGQFTKRYPLATFATFTKEQLDNLLYNPENGLFAGNARLMDTQIDSWETPDGEVETETKNEKTTRQIAATEVQKVWEGAHKRMKWDTLQKKSIEEKIKLFNDAKLTYNGQDKVTYTIVAKQSKDAKGNVRIIYSGENISKREKIDRKDNTDIVFQKRIPIFEDLVVYSETKPQEFKVADTKNKKYEIKNGKYKDFYIYQWRQGKMLVYGVSRNIYGKHNAFHQSNTLEDAINYIDRHTISETDSDIISQYCYYDIYYNAHENTLLNAKLDKRKVEGANYTIKRYDTPMLAYSLSELPTGLRKVLDLNLFEFTSLAKKHLKILGEDNLRKIDSSQKAMLFVLEVYEALRNDEVFVDQMRQENVTIQYLFETLGKKLNQSSKLKNSTQNALVENIRNHIKAIDEAQDVTYVNDRTLLSGNQSVARLKEMRYNGKEINVEGNVNGKYYEEMKEVTLTSAINKLRDLFHVNIETTDRGELLDPEGIFADKIANGEISEKNVDTIKAFIHDNKIYINTANADTKNLNHEMAHMILGVLKVQNENAYNELIKALSEGSQIFKSRLTRKSKSDLYKNMARADLEEEVIADMIANELDQNTALSAFGELTGAAESAYAEYWNSIFDTIKQIIAESTSEAEDAHFNDHLDSVIKVLSGQARNTQEIFTKFTKRRKITNLIERYIRNGDIIEKCV